jgi:hypothetical protein
LKVTIRSNHTALHGAEVKKNPPILEYCFGCIGLMDTGGNLYNECWPGVICLRALRGGS